MGPWPLTSLMTLTLDVSRCHVGLINVKCKRNQLIWYWADCMTLPFDHTHDLDLGIEISRSESEIALSQEWDGWLTSNEKGVSYPFMTMIFTSVTMVGWADVLDSAWGHFRRGRAINISSFFYGNNTHLPVTIKISINEVNMWSCAASVSGPVKAAAFCTNYLVIDLNINNSTLIWPPLKFIYFFIKFTIKLCFSSSLV